jgi:hypothetical protein
MLIISISRARPDGGADLIAHSADPAVVEAAVAALERALGRTAPSCRRGLRLARKGRRPGPREPEPAP